MQKTSFNGYERKYNKCLYKERKVKETKEMRKGKGGKKEVWKE